MVIEGHVPVLMNDEGISTHGKGKLETETVMMTVLLLLLLLLLKQGQQIPIKNMYLI